MRRRPVLDDYFVPEGIELLYASSDSGTENPANRTLMLGDRYASALLVEIERGGHMNLGSAQTNVPHTDYFRIWVRREPRSAATKK